MKKILKKFFLFFQKENYYKIILASIIIFSICIRLYIFYSYKPSDIGKVGVSVSLLDIAYCVINNEEFSFNLDRHIWIEKNINDLMDGRISITPDFSNSERVSITYMDPGYGILIGLFFKILNLNVSVRVILFLQIICDTILLFLIYSLGRRLGLSKIYALIPVGLHGINILILKTVFQFLQDFSVVFIIVLILWLFNYKNKVRKLNFLKLGLLLILGGLLPWVRSLFILFPIGLLLIMIILRKINKVPQIFVKYSFFLTLGSLILFVVPRNIQFAKHDLPFSFGRPGCFYYTFYCGLHQFDDGLKGDDLTRKVLYELDGDLKEKHILYSWTKMDSLLKPLVIEEIGDDPTNYLINSSRRLLVGIFPSFYNNFDNKLNIPEFIVIFGRVILFIITLITFYFVFLTLKNYQSFETLLLLYPWLYIALVSAPFYFQGRSFIPSIDFIVIFFFLGINKISSGNLKSLINKKHYTQ